MFLTLQRLVTFKVNTVFVSEMTGQAHKVPSSKRKSVDPDTTSWLGSGHLQIYCLHYDLHYNSNKLVSYTVNLRDDTHIRDDWHV